VIHLSTKKGKAKPILPDIPSDWDGFFHECKNLVDEGDDYYRCLAKSLIEVDIIEGKSCVECDQECHNYRKGGIER